MSITFFEWESYIGHNVKVTLKDETHIIGYFSEYDTNSITIVKDSDKGLADNIPKARVARMKLIGDDA